jgi:hypothetical protein
MEPQMKRQFAENFSRRALLQTGGLAFAGAWLGRALPTADQNPLSGARLYRDVETYFQLGEHRTATAVDLKTSDWLAAQLKAAGYQTRFHPFTTPQFFPRQTHVAVKGKTIAAFPLWPVRATGKQPVRAPLASYAKNADVKGCLALVKFPFDARASVVSDHVKLIAEIAQAGAVGVIAVTEGATGEIIALNSFSHLKTWPIPVAVVAPRDAPTLHEAAQAKTEATLLIDGQDEPQAQARNVVGRLEHGEKLIVVSTPQSGWFGCAGERGPGIALWLGLARWAAARKANTSFLFVSTSGHELGGLGMKSFMEKEAPPPERVLCWLHLGAGIATWEWQETPQGLKKTNQVDPRRYLMCSSELAPTLTPLFADLPGLRPIIDRAVGEFELMKAKGYQAFGIAAGHRFHHVRGDRPENTAPELLEPVGAALVKALEAIEVKSRTN